MIARASIVLLACALAWVSACATVPSQFSPRSAASPQAAESPRATIGLALREDPPLPGESTEGWAGLATPSGGGMPMGHMHHHGMDMQGMEGMDMQDAPDAGPLPACMEGMDMGPCTPRATDARPLPACMEGMDMGPCTPRATDAGTGSATHAH